MIAVTWLCFLVATLPCLSQAAGACCPGDGPADNAIAKAPPTSHPCGSDANPTTIPAQADLAAGADDSCPVMMADGCCETPTPTLEDRSPKVPQKIAEAAAAWQPAVEPLPLQPASGDHSSTGPPPGLWHASPVHLELCTFLI